MICQNNEVEILADHVISDHIHLLVLYPESRIIYTQISPKWFKLIFKQKSF